MYQVIIVFIDIKRYFFFFIPDYLKIIERSVEVSIRLFLFSGVVYCSIVYLATRPFNWDFVKYQVHLSGPTFYPDVCTHEICCSFLL